MGTNSLPKLAAAPTKVAATTTQYNSAVDALQGHIVMRDSYGAVEDGVSDIGQPSSGRPRKIHVSEGITVGGQTLNTTQFLLSRTGIQSGLAKDSGFPQFLEPGDQTGTGGGSYVRVLASSTDPLEMTIDGTAYTLEAELTSDDLALASNSTCLVADSDIAGDPVWSKTLGEHGGVILIDTIGADIIALNNTIQCFKITNGSETEVFIAYIKTTASMLVPILRGIGGTDRIVFSDNDTITLLKAHYIFLDNDLSTIDTTTTHPAYGKNSPNSPITGDYWWDTENKTWQRYSGATWETLGRIYLGYAICDFSSCLWVEHVDFDLPWDDFIGDYEFLSNAGPGEGIQSYTADILKLSVAGNYIETNEISISGLNFTKIEPGYTEQASTWYYLYISNLGDLILSPIVPRKKDHRRGWYHPKEYWRCVAFFYNDGASDFIFSYSNPGSGKIDFSAVGIVISDSTTGGLKTLHLNLAPIVESIHLTLYQTTSASAQLIYLYAGKYGNNLMIDHHSSINAQNIPAEITLNQIGNATIRYNITGTYTIKFIVGACNIKW
jgi:hypothetical protein